MSQVHRSSDPYKAMRAAVSSDKILERPTDLRFLQPTGLGFLTNSGHKTSIFQGASKSIEDASLIVIFEYFPKNASSKAALLENGRLIADQCSSDPSVASFWILEYRPEYEDNAITVFTRLTSSRIYHSKYERTFSRFRDDVAALCSDIRITKWIESGIGFIGRN